MATIERSATFAAPGQPDSPVELKARYENFIGGHWVAPVEGEYSTNVTPATGEPFTEIPRSTAADVDLAQPRGERHALPGEGRVHLLRQRDDLRDAALRGGRRGP